MAEKRAGACAECGRVRPLYGNGLCNSCKRKENLEKNKRACAECGEIGHIIAHGLCKACYRRWRYHNDEDYHKRTLKRARKWQNENRNKIRARERARNKAKSRKAACSILTQHEEYMRNVRDDPESLDRTFMAELIGIECDYGDVDIDEFSRVATIDREREDVVDALFGPLVEKGKKNIEES